MLKFDSEPYFDDYAAEKDFYRILFRPSYAVQARELTQLQTILQNQVTRFGDHVFKNGSQVIPGSVNVDNKVHFVKLEQFTGTIDVTTYIETLKNKIITGETSGVKMRVLDTSEGGTIVENQDIPTLYCKVEGTSDDNETNRLLPGENIIAYAVDNQMTTNFRLKEDQLNDISAVVKLTGNLGETATTYTNNSSSDVLGYAYSVEVEAGIYYIDGIFVRNDNLKLYVGRFNNTPSCRVGFKVTEEYVTPEKDKTILDNAAGASNFAAPGAHRYKISVTLVKLDPVATDNIRFVELVRIIDGRVQQKVEKASYAELEKTLARRTFDESGNYEVNKFKCSIREHLDNGSNFGVYPLLTGVPVDGRVYGSPDKFVMVVDPGKAYIQGYEVESVASQFIDFDKARVINGAENNHVQRTAEQTVGLNVGNYVKITNVYRTPAVNSFDKVYLVKTIQPKPAVLSTTISGGAVTAITVVDGGEGYTGTPTIEILPLTSAGSGCTATATVTNGKITSVAVTAGGTLYAVAPEARAAISSASISLGQTPATSTIVGTARVKAIQLDSPNYTVPTSSIYKLGLFDINMFSGYSFDRDVKSVVGTGSTNNFTANIYSSNMPLIGSASVTASTTSTTVTGVGTNFNDSVKVGDVLFLNDIRIGTVTAINSNLSVTVSSASTTVAGGRIAIFTAPIYEPKYETLLFPVGKNNIKTLRGVEKVSDTVISDTLKASTIITRRVFPTINSASYNFKAQFEVTDVDETLLSDSDLSNYMLINNDTGMPVNINEAMITFDNDTTRKVVTIGPVPAGYYYLIASVQQKAGAAKERVKVINRSFGQTILGKKVVTSDSIDLNFGDVLKLVSVRMTPGNYDAYDAASSVDITDRYTLDNGQRATYYTYGKLLLKPGAQVPSGAIRVVYDYFSVSAETGNYNYFSVDSYNISGLSYDEIPSYYVTDSTTGKKVETPLTDVLDFRPILTTTNGFYPQIPKIGSDMITPVANYLGRIDKVVLDSVGKFNVITGVPSPDPKEPEDPKEGMVIASLTIPPYTKDVSQVVIKQRENRRYTMRDIGKLERRISNLEYYVTLSLLEKDTASLQVRDETTGLDRFKNGFIVDQFTGHNVGDVKNEDYSISIDTENRIMRPMHNTVDLEIVENLSSGTDRAYKAYQKSGDLVTLPYTKDAYIFNNNATRAMDIHAISMGAFKGQINLFPEGDNWKSTERRPDLVAVDDNNYDAIKFLADAAGVTGTKWNEWQTNWTSVSTRSTTSETRNFDSSRGAWGNWLQVTGYQTTFTDYSGYNWRDGISTSLTSSVNAQDYGDRVVDMSYIPYMRARPVTFLAQNLKGTTRFFGFFDGTAVDSYIKPADKFTVTRVGNSLVSFDVNDLNGNVLSDVVERAYNGKIEPAFGIGDVLTNTNHNATNITSVANLSAPAASFTLTVSDLSGIKPGHHVVLYNLNYHNAYTDKNLSDLHENQNIPASVGLTNPAASSAELNLRKFKVLSVTAATSNADAIVRLGNIDGSDIAAFSSYATSSYSGTNRGKLMRLKASCVVAHGGIIKSSDTIGPIIQDIHVVNVKNGFAIGETLTGSVTIGETSSMNGVTITYINDGNSELVPPTMKSLGDKIVTDENGTAVGVFYIPETDALSFRTGERTFKLTDNQSNSNASFDSIGSTVYYSQGISLTKERTIVSSRTAQFVQASTYEDTQSLPPVRRTTTSTRQIYQYAYDPLAQTFTVNSPGGVFLTGIDLYFAVAGKRPVSIELRNTDNGVPSSKVIPFSQVTRVASDLKTSDDSSVATTFDFKAPVYLQDTETYCFVVMTDEPGTQLYVSEMGSTDILTGNTIAGQPLTGSLYASQNAKEWEIHPLLDMKFVMKKATFSTSTEAEVQFKANPPKKYKLPTNPFQINTGTNKIRIFAPDHGFTANEVVVIDGVPAGLHGANSTTYGIPDTLLNAKHTVLSTGLERDSFVISLVTTDGSGNNLLKGTTSNFIKGKYGGTEVYCSKSLAMDLLYFKTSDLSFKDTRIDYYVSTQKESTKGYTDFVPFVPNNNYAFSERMHISSYENQVIQTENPLIKKSSLLIKAVISSTNPNISPVIDLQQLSAFAVSNVVNNQIASSINVPELDTRPVLVATNIGAVDITTLGTGTITTATNSATVTGGTAGTNAVNFAAQVFAGNILKTTAGVTIGTVASISGTNITLTGNAAVALTAQPFNIVSAATLTCENVTVNGKLVGQIRTNIDTADNLLATAGIGKTMVISGVHANVDGTYVVQDINVVEDKTVYAGNTELDVTKVIFDKPFAGSTVPATIATMDMISDPDFTISVYDKFVDDVAPYGCHNAANYITRTLTLTDPATILKILFDANIVNNTQIKVYYRTWTGNVDLRKIPYRDTGYISSGYDSEGKFVERSIDLMNLSPFNNVQIKIVLKSNNPVFIPKVKNLRMLALS